MDAYRRAHVYVRDAFAGILAETDYGYSFTYDEGYLADPHSTAISLTLPKSEEGYRSNHLFPFLEMLRF